MPSRAAEETQSASLNTVASTKRTRHMDFADTIPVFNDETRKKRRKGRKAANGTTQKPRGGAPTEGEMINICDVGGDEDEDEAENDVDGRQPHQKGFYKGNNKILIESSTIKFRIYLLNVNAFPSALESQEWSEKCFIAAGKDLYGSQHEGEFGFNLYIIPYPAYSRVSRALDSCYAAVHEWDPQARELSYNFIMA